MYQNLHRMCFEKICFNDDDKILCAGAGTGNEILSILKSNSTVSVVGVDYSHNALRKAAEKTKEFSQRVELRQMDVCKLEFADNTFDKATCLHVMDFISEEGKVTGEIIRVLKPGGEFVITYPSEKDNPQMGLRLLKDSWNRYHMNGSLFEFFKSLVQVAAGIIYVPFLFRSRRKYSQGELKAMFRNLLSIEPEFQEHPEYQDIIVSGKK